MNWRMFVPGRLRSEQAQPHQLRGSSTDDLAAQIYAAWHSLRQVELKKHQRSGERRLCDETGEEGLSDFGSGIQAENPSGAEQSTQGGSFALLPVVVWTRNDRPFLKDRFGWVDSDLCWWCGSARQTREHLFKECITWKDDIRELWRKVGEASSRDGDTAVGRAFR